MNYTGLIVGGITILIIGVFHPLIIWAEYHFSKKIWPLFAVAGAILAILSLKSESDIASSLLAVTAASCFWSIRELHQQAERVARGWFPGKDREDVQRSAFP